VWKVKNTRIWSCEQLKPSKPSNNKFQVYVRSAEMLFGNITMGSRILFSMSGSCKKAKGRGVRKEKNLRKQDKKQNGNKKRQN